MPTVTETRTVFESFDFDVPGVYRLVLVVDVDTANNGTLRSETLREVRIDASGRPGHETNYSANVQGLREISSYADPVTYPPVPPGETRVWSGLSLRIDNRDVSYMLS